MADKIVHVPTPDEQLNEFLNTPGSTPAEVEEARAWTKAENQRRQQFGREWAKDRKAANVSRAKSLSDAIYGDVQLANDLCDRVSKGEFDTVDELLAVGAQIRKRLTRYEREVVSIDTTDETIAALEADPAKWFHEFYEKYPVLAAQVPTLAGALASWRDNRR